MSEEVVNAQRSVKRYDVEVYSWFGIAHWKLVESKVGDFVYASDYDELRKRVAWMIECYDVDQWLFSDCDIIMGECVEEIGASYNAARKAVEELL